MIVSPTHEVKPAMQAPQEAMAMDATTSARIHEVAQSELMDAPWHFEDEGWDQSRLKGAVTIVQADGVTRTDDGWAVQGRRGEYVIPLATMRCPCKAATSGKTHVCRHRVAVELYTRVQRALLPYNERVPSPTVSEEHDPEAMTIDRQTGEIIDTPSPSAQDGPEATITPQTDPQGVPEQERIVIPGRALESEALTDTLAPLPPPPVLNGHTTQPRRTPLLDLQLPLRSIHAILADLSKPLPPKCIASRQQGGRKIEFIHWYTAVEVLDAYAPGWRGEVRGIHEVTTVVGKQEDLRSVKAWATVYRITIPCAEGEVYREAIGLEHEAEPIYGDTMTNAQATGFKRCAALFGVGADLYDKDDKGEHLAGALLHEKAELLKLLRPELERRGLEPQEVLHWLKRQTGAVRNADIAIGALKAFMAHLGVVEREQGTDEAA